MHEGDVEQGDQDEELDLEVGLAEQGERDDDEEEASEEEHD